MSNHTLSEMFFKPNFLIKILFLFLLNTKWELDECLPNAKWSILSMNTVIGEIIKILLHNYCRQRKPRLRLIPVVLCFSSLGSCFHSILILTDEIKLLLLVLVFRHMFLYISEDKHVPNNFSICHSLVSLLIFCVPLWHKPRVNTDNISVF